MNLRREARWLRPIAAIMVVALVCGAYILSKQRLEPPFQDRYALWFEFAAADAVTPGMGAPVTVAGVTVGQIDGRRLKDGRGLVRASIDPSRLPEVYADARAALVPNTPLKDMQIRLNPGSRSAPALEDGATIAIRRTTSPLNSDELLRALDEDTRTFLQALLNDAGIGTRGRGRSLRATLRALGPTAAQLRRITGLLADRRRQIPRLVGNLRRITEATADGDADLRTVVDAGNATLAALADDDEALKATLDELPATLQAARTTLQRTPRFMRALDGALRELEPSLRSARRTLRSTPGALRGIVPLPVSELERFIDDVAPLAPSVRGTVRDLGEATPPLRTAFEVLGRTVNRLASTPEDGSKSSLFWLAWFAHNVNSTISTQDAHGSVAHGMALLSCATLGPTGDLGELVNGVLGTTSFCQDGAAR